MSEPTSAPASTLAPSQPVSRAQSLKEKTVAVAPAEPATLAFRDAPNAREAKDNAPTHVVIQCLFMSLAGLLFGWETGAISGLVTMPDYQMRFGAPDATSSSGYSIPSTRQSLITSFCGLGAFFGSLLAGKISGNLGIKVAFMISLFIFLVGVAIECSAMYQWGQILAGRFIAGYGIGSLSMLAPLYQAECSPKQLRGLISSTFQLCATFGIFFANAVNYGLQNRVGEVSWRVVLAIQLPVGLLIFLGIVFCPESPRYYIMRGNVDQARINLSKLRGFAPGTPALEAELDELVRKDAEEKLGAEAGYLDCFKSEGRMALLTQNAAYGTKFFASAGISDSHLIQVIIAAVNVVSTFPGLWAVENLGRRKTLIIGSAIMFVGQVVAGALGTAYPDGAVAGKILITFSCVFVFGFASTWGPLGWVVAAEQFPVRMAPYCVALATGSNWINNFILAIITPYITDAGYGNLQGKHFITFIWAAAIVLFAVFVFFFVPETKGLSLVQIDELYLSRVPAWRSASWVPFGGESKRNQTEAGSLKLVQSAKHNENFAARDLEDDDELRKGHFAEFETLYGYRGKADPQTPFVMEDVQLSEGGLFAKAPVTVERRDPKTDALLSSDTVSSHVPVLLSLLFSSLVHPDVAFAKLRKAFDAFSEWRNVVKVVLSDSMVQSVDGMKFERDIWGWTDPEEPTCICLSLVHHDELNKLEERLRVATSSERHELLGQYCSCELAVILLGAPEVAHSILRVYSPKVACTPERLRFTSGIQRRQDLNALRVNPDRGELGDYVEQMPRADPPLLLTIQQRSAHESPALFYALALGALGPAMVLIVPDVRAKYFGWKPVERPPTAYPLPNRPRDSSLSGFDDPKPKA
ncbi:hypothetical protein MNV49_005072 [Pseudohyphozyma bogoriensis]|nr:hypothetical protein MNV49_005072 [Pseudohyphozyma bogoriensis]